MNTLFSFVVILLVLLSCSAFCANRFANSFTECQHLDPITCWKDRGTCNQDPPLKTIQPGSPIRDDTFGQLIANQMLWRLPGIDFMSLGFNIFKGTSEVFPIFLFCYQQSSSITRRLQDTYRGNTYIIPDEVYAAASPMCSYTMESKSYSSAQAYASSMMVETGVSADIEASYSKLGFSASARVAFSQESSVSAAMSVQQKQSGSIAVTQASCETIKIQLEDVDFTSFHPRFVHDVFEANTTSDYYNLIKKYGTHYMTSAIMGGKLVQISSTASSFINTKSEREVKERREASFSAAASGYGISGSAAGQYSSSHSGKKEEQKEYESKTAKSSIISYGGAAGSFGPSKDSSSTASWGDWAKTVDLAPVPIKYSLRLISDIIPPKWENKNKENIKQAWTSALAWYWKEEESKILREHLQGQNVYIITVAMSDKSPSQIVSYSFKLLGNSKTLNTEPHQLFTEKFSPPSSPDITKHMTKQLRFATNAIYTFKVQQKEVIGFTGTLELCTASSILGRKDMRLSQFCAENITITDVLNSATYYYNLHDGLKDHESGCVQLQSKPMQNTLRISFTVQDITRNSETLFIKFTFVGTLGQSVFHVLSDYFKVVSTGTYMKNFNCKKNIGFITKVSMELVVAVVAYNKKFVIDGSSMIINYSVNGNIHTFESTTLQPQELSAFTPVTFGIKLV